MTTVRHGAALAMIVIFMVACGESTRSAPRTAAPRTATVPIAEASPTDAPGGLVTRSDFEHWPFLPDAGTLACHPSGKNDGRLLVTLSFVDGIDYALNGSARDFGFPELDTTVMPDWPDASALGPIIERGLALCAQ